MTVAACGIRRVQAKKGGLVSPFSLNASTTVDVIAI
jgi:hypothetical protein